MKNLGLIEEVEMLDDRRKFMRFDMPLSLEFKTTTESNDYYLGLTRNFSREGFSFISQDCNYDTGTTLELKVQMPERNTYIDGSGEIIWRKQIGDKWHTGLKLKTIDKSAKVEILEYAYEKWVHSEKKQRQSIN